LVQISDELECLSSYAEGTAFGDDCTVWGSVEGFFCVDEGDVRGLSILSRAIRKVVYQGGLCYCFFVGPEAGLLLAETVGGEGAFEDASGEDGGDEFGYRLDE